jgi:hypothetical protein
MITVYSTGFSTPPGPDSTLIVCHSNFNWGFFPMNPILGNDVYDFVTRLQIDPNEIYYCIHLFNRSIANKTAIHIDIIDVDHNDQALTFYTDKKITLQFIFEANYQLIRRWFSNP